MELEILKKLNWSLSPMTPNAWMRTYMQILHGPKKTDCISFSIPAYNGLPFSRVMQVLILYDTQKYKITDKNIVFSF